MSEDRKKTVSHFTTRWENLKGRVRYLLKNKNKDASACLGEAICEELDAFETRLNALEKRMGE